jgi:prepilin-type N-terminal cleavage/methylation domain-containing protein
MRNKIKINKKFGHACRQAGFTLVELLVVISIIGVLTTLLAVNFVGSRERANDSQKIQNLNAAKNALRMYYNDYQKYPSNFSDIGSSYFPDYSKVQSYTGFSYQSSSSDSFIIRATLDSGANVDTGQSQLSCGIAVGSTQPSVYAVCAN